MPARTRTSFVVYRDCDAAWYKRYSRPWVISVVQEKPVNDQGDSNCNCAALVACRKPHRIRTKTANTRMTTPKAITHGFDCRVLVTWTPTMSPRANT